jgi:CheY-like chemotaxis protein
VPLPQLAGKRVLVVEDDYLVAMEIARALERAGAEVIGPAPTVEAALDALEQTAPDGANLDVNQGRKLPSRWPTHSWARGIPSIFATGYDFLTLRTREAMRETDGVGTDRFGPVWVRRAPVGDRILKAQPPLDSRRHGACPYRMQPSDVWMRL